MNESASSNPPSAPVLTHLASTLHRAVAQDERVVLLGEDVADGGMLGLSRPVVEDDGLAARALATPLSSAGLVAHAGGLARGGLRPIVIASDAAVLVDGFAALRRIGRSRNSRNILVLCPCGPGFGLGNDAADSPESLLANVDGIEVRSAGTPERLPASVDAASRNWKADEGPRVLLLPRNCLVSELAFSELAAVEQANDADETPAAFEDEATTRVHREGPNATIFCWGSSVEHACAAADACGEDHRATVVELTRLAPLDEDAIYRHAAETGKIVIAQPGRAPAGIGSQIAACLADRAILKLDSPVRIVQGRATPHAHRERLAVPAVEDLVAAIQHVATY